MPVYQSGKNIAVAYKFQTAKDSVESGSGGTRLMGLRDFTGLDLSSANIESQAIRSDGQTNKGRLGSQFVTASYPLELGVTNALDWIEAGLRGTWTAAANLTEATGSLGAITIAATTITNAGGSWLTEGARAGQMIKLADTGETANHDRWVRVLSVTASIITVPAASFTASGPEAAWTLTIAKHVYPSNPPTERYCTIEEVYQDIDESVVGENCKIGSMGLSITADNLVLLTFGVGGTALEEYADANSPQLTAPTETESQALVLLDGKLRIRGTDWVDVTSCELNFNLNPSGQPVTGTRVSPDVFLSNAVGSGSISMLVSDLAEFTAFKSEDDVELFIVAQEPEADPADFISFYVGNGGYRSSQRPGGGDSAMVQTHDFTFGVDDNGADRYAAMMVVSTSAA